MQNLEVAEGVSDPTIENIGERCRGVTCGEGVDVVFDCAGVERALKAGMDALKYEGVYVNVAGWVTPVCFFYLWVFW
jgi:threonine dehydrogenase-like Zn-dependent dehydrogenase